MAYRGLAYILMQQLKKVQQWLSHVFGFSLSDSESYFCVTKKDKRWVHKLRLSNAHLYTWANIQIVLVASILSVFPMVSVLGDMKF